jgi:hypothetical protein
LHNFYVSEGSISGIDDTVDELWWTRNQLNFIAAFRYFRALRVKASNVGTITVVVIVAAVLIAFFRVLFGHGESEEGVISACGRHVETT